MRRRYTPADADALLLDPKRIRRACDYMHNPAFMRARATTVDYLGRRLFDSVHGAATIRAAALELDHDVRRLLKGEAIALEPLREAEIPKPDGRKRTIFVPTYRARCFVNLLNNVLVETSDHLLLPHVRAYRPGLRHAVTHAAKDLAEAVVTGKARYWAKLDVRNFFHEIPHEMIAAALARRGYSEAFHQVVLTLARSPIWAAVADQEFEAASNETGVPMGLAASATLANLACWQIDAVLHELRGHVACIRYADDFLLVSPYRDRLIHAVRQVQQWARKNGLKLKGVSPDQRPRSLVHAFQSRPMPALGFEIHRSGHIQVPPAKVTAKEEEVDRLMDRLHENGEIVLGRSSYDDPSGVRVVGTDMMDTSDIRAVVEGAFLDWQQCDPDGADSYLRRARARHPELLDRSSSTIWVASLGDSGDGAHEGLRCRPLTSARPIPPMPSPGSLRDRGMAREGAVDTDDRAGNLYTGGTNSIANPTHNDEAQVSSGLTVSSTSDHSQTRNRDGTLGLGDGRTGDHLHGDPSGSDVGMVGSEGSHGLTSGGITTTNPGWDEDQNRGLEWLKWRLNSMDTSSLDNWFSIVSQVVTWLPRGATDTAQPAPSRLRCFVNFGIHAYHDFRHTTASGSRVVVTLGGAELEKFYPRVPTEVALVRELRKRVAVEIAQGKRVVMVETDPWLPKHLLQSCRHFHSVALFGAVLALHADVRRAGTWLLLASRSEP